MVVLILFFQIERESCNVITLHSWYSFFALFQSYKINIFILPKNVSFPNRTHHFLFGQGLDIIPVLKINQHLFPLMFKNIEHIFILIEYKNIMADLT